MVLDISIPGVLQVDVTDCVKGMIAGFPEELSGKTKAPWNENLFKVDPTPKMLGAERAKLFHAFVVKGTLASCASAAARSPGCPTSHCLYGNKSNQTK